MKLTLKTMKESQVTILFNHLNLGYKIDRVRAFKDHGIADLRSRISDVYNRYGIYADRETKKGKRYLQYFFKNKLK